jgi:hypothetical protein
MVTTRNRSGAIGTHGDATQSVGEVPRNELENACMEVIVVAQDMDMKPRIVMITSIVNGNRGADIQDARASADGVPRLENEGVLTTVDARAALTWLVNATKLKDANGIDGVRARDVRVHRRDVGKGIALAIEPASMASTERIIVGKIITKRRNATCLAIGRFGDDGRAAPRIVGGDTNIVLETAQSRVHVAVENIHRRWIAPPNMDANGINGGIGANVTRNARNELEPENVPTVITAAQRVKDMTMEFAKCKDIIVALTLVPIDAY